MKNNFAKRVYMSPPCECIFFTINTHNAMKLCVHVVKSSLVIFLWIKVIDGCKKLLKILHFVFKTKSLVAIVAMSFDSKVTTPTVMHSAWALQVAHCKHNSTYQ